MKGLNYYLFESGLKKGFVARTVINNHYTEDEFLAAMNKNQPEIPLNTLKDVFNNMAETAAEILLQGISIRIPNFIKLSPAIKGSFETSNDSFDSGKHYVGINSSVSQAFVNNFQKKVKVAKIDKPVNAPEILLIEDNKTKQNALQLTYANKIMGINLLLAGCQFEGLKIINQDDQTKYLLIPTASLDIIHLKDKELAYSIHRSFVPPEWLVNELDIFIKLVYRNEESGMERESDYFETKWLN